ncbi:MAG: hypothetical protein L7F78_09460, partial [Syntrophales bacterium LBB04]|nr:hypothetical protein [Syntrophales bacterium LBB04]
MRKLSILLGLGLCSVLFAVALPLQAAVNDLACISCHERPAYREAKDGGKEAVHFKRQELSESVHKSLGCVDCHADISRLPHDKEIARVDCARCHREVSLQFGKGIHGVALKEGDKDAPSCVSCHGDHRVFRVADQRSPANRMNQVILCAKCHTDIEVQKKHRLPTGMIKAYENSVHGRFLKEGKAVRAAVCSDCHRAHLVLGPKDPDSSTGKGNIGQVCGRCHVQIYNE